MRRFLTLGLVLSLGVVGFSLVGCPGSSGNPDAGHPDSGAPDSGRPDSGTPDSGTPDSGAPDSGTPDSGTPDGGDAGTTTQTLTVKNYLRWCNVSVNGQAASSAATQTVDVAPGHIPLSAVALPGFILGSAPWHDTDGDTGSGDPGTVTGSGQSASSATTATVGNTAKCVWVCCPFSNGSGCPSTDQCP